MITKSILIVCCVLCVCYSYAQWEASLGAGAGLPITGYNEVVKTGWLLSGEGKYRLNRKFAVGMKAQFTRMQNDKNPNDAFQQTRMTIVPLLFLAEYLITDKGRFQPYATGGLGISFFTIHYENSSIQGTSINNVSFTMMPQAGVKYAASHKIYPFLESGLVLLADGPPVGFPKGEQMTGYGFITIGVHYRF